jgi:hypothetical protein
MSKTSKILLIVVLCVIVILSIIVIVKNSKVEKQKTLSETFNNLSNMSIGKDITSDSNSPESIKPDFIGKESVLNVVK